MLRLSKDRWLQLSPLLDEALDRSPEDRSAWLDALRVSSPSDADDLAELLRETDRTSSLLGGVDVMATREAEVTGEWIGQRLGAWQIDALLGRGGMAAVYRARRVDGRFDGLAAAKLLHAARYLRDGDGRVRQEAAALARLSHPNIARLHDAGLTDSGEPYLILELVDGVPIDQWCDERRAPIERRVALMLEVCDAVAHAHEKLIIHRDLKPSNILVTPQGAVKLLDFGIAELMDAAAHPGPTAPPRAFTPAYASPEQVRGESVTTATDVYALGVLLHQLLCGRHPTAPPGATLPALLRSIEDAAPMSLPLRVRRDPERHALARSRGTTGEALATALAGDLDAIVRKALAKDPSMRYRTVSMLAEDLARAARFEPVLAREQTAWYRGRRFVRRHRVGVAATVASFAVLASAVVVTTAQSVEARRQQDAAQFEARRSAAASEMLGAVLTDLGSGPAVADSITSRLSEVLLRQYQGDPRIHGRLLLDLAGLLEGLDRGSASEQAIREALRVARVARDRALDAGIACVRAQRAAESDSAAAARALLDSAAVLLAPTDTASVAAVQCQLARASLALAGDHDMRAAEVAARRALAWLRATGDSTSARYQGALTTLDLTLMFDQSRRRDRLAIAQRLRRLALETGRARSAFALSAATSEADVLFALGEVRAADSVLRATIASFGYPGPDDVPWQVSKLLGLSAFYLADHDSALVWIRASIARALADSSPRLAESAMNRLPEMLLKAGRIDEARTAVKEYREFSRRTGRVTVTMSTLMDARIHAATGAAERAWFTADSLVRAHGWPDRFRAGSPTLELSALADFSIQTKRYALADSAAEAVATLMERGDSLASGRNIWVGRSHGLRARAALARGDSTRAGELATQALVSLRLNLGPAHPWVRDVEEMLPGSARPR